MGKGGRVGEENGWGRKRGKGKGKKLTSFIILKAEWIQHIFCIF